MKEKRKHRDNDEEMTEENNFQTENCECEESCDCDEKDCKCPECDGCCDEGCCCDEECTCEQECGQEHMCEHEHCHHHGHEASEYLAMAQRLQADFENYRKRVAEQLDKERQNGAESVIEVFLPCLDTFKEAKKSIDDERILAGFNMVEDKILDALKTLGVEKIEAIGNKFDPHIHNVIAVMNDENKEEDVILEEYQSGWMMNGKVIRYSKVIVNKHL